MFTHLIFLILVASTLSASIKTVKWYPNTVKTCTRDNLIALTFDDGPSWDYVNILDILKRNNIKATFFVLGKLLSGNSALSRRAIQEGHIIASHSYSHLSLPGLGSEGNTVFLSPRFSFKSDKKLLKLTIKESAGS